MFVRKSTYEDLKFQFETITASEANLRKMLIAERSDRASLNQQHNEKISGLEASGKALIRRVETLTEENTKLSQANEKLLDESAEFNKQVDELTARYNALQEEFNSFKDTANSVAAKLEEAKKPSKKKKKAENPTAVSEPKAKATKKK